MSPCHLLWTFCWLCWPTVILAQPITFVTAPNIYATAEGPGSSNGLIRNLANPRTVQLIFDQNQLSGLVNHQITSVFYRLSSNLPGGYPLVQTTWTEYQIQLGPSHSPVDADVTFAANYVSSPVMVRTGPLSVATFSWTIGTNPSPWGVEILFNTPYFYTGGHLAMQVTHPGSNNPDQGNSLLDASSGSSPGVGVDYTAFSANTFNALSGIETPFVNVIQFKGIAAVPEPRSLLLLLLLGILVLKVKMTTNQKV
jgi:hypothetical protein